MLKIFFLTLFLFNAHAAEEFFSCDSPLESPRKRRKLMKETPAQDETINAFEESFFASLPDELILHVLSFLPTPKDHTNARAVCRKFYACDQEAEAWEKVHVRIENEKQLLGLLASKAPPPFSNLEFDGQYALLLLKDGDKYGMLGDLFKRHQKHLKSIHFRWIPSIDYDSDTFKAFLSLKNLKRLIIKEFSRRENATLLEYIGSSFPDLKALQVDLEEGETVVHLPVQFNNLKKLESLAVSDVQEDEFNSYLALAKPPLRHLSFEGMQVQKIVPALYELDLLEHVDISGCDISVETARALGGLPGLKKFTFCGMSMKDCALTAFIQGAFQTLKELCLYSPNLQSIDPILQLSNLEDLRIVNPVRRIDFSEIKQLSKLKSLRLEKCFVADSDLEAISLRCLSLEEVFISLPGRMSLWNMQNYQLKGIGSLSNLQALKMISVENGKANHEDVRWLHTLPYLQTLSLKGTRNLRSADVFLEGFPALKKLNLKSTGVLGVGALQEARPEINIDFSPLIRLQFD